jgi:cephalosporin-C deacetylase-like acetyl esterase
MRDVVTFAMAQPRLDPDRVGVWGTSLSGGEAIIHGAIDRRVACVIAQAPLVGGSRNLDRIVPAAAQPRLLDLLHFERENVRLACE